MRVVVYVDGENHFHRTCEACRSVFGNFSSLEEVKKKRRVGGAAAYPDEYEPIVEARQDIFFFWDKHIMDFLARSFRRAIAAPARNVVSGVYATSTKGDLDEVHEARVWIRNRGFDPLVHHESKKDRTNREHKTRSKAKTLDVALAVRILEDAYHNVYDTCYLFSSDLDFIPVIQAVKRLGKHVIVCGYKDAIGKRSELQFVPDGFADLTPRVKEYHID